MGVRHSACATGAAGTARLVSAARIGDVEQLRAELDFVDSLKRYTKAEEVETLGFYNSI